MINLLYYDIISHYIIMAKVAAGGCRFCSQCCHAVLKNLKNWIVFSDTGNNFMEMKSASYLTM